MLINNESCAPLTITTALRTVKSALPFVASGKPPLTGHVAQFFGSRPVAEELIALAPQADTSSPSAPIRISLLDNPVDAPKLTSTKLPSELSF